MRYALRAKVFPDSWESYIPDLLRHCVDYGIDEVIFSEQCHEIAAVPLPLAFHQKTADALGEILPLFRERGISCSFFLQAATGHVNAELPPQRVLPFQKFVGDDLVPSFCEPCLLDEGFQDYLAQIAAIYAPLLLDKFYLDDDFRNTNHNGGRIGCFCPLHARAAGDALGETLTSEELLRRVVRNTPDGLRTRRAWMEQNFKGELAAARKIERALHAAAPRTLLGLMNSGEAQHSLEGRDMPLLLQTLAGEQGAPLSRPAGGAYGDVLHEDVLNMHHMTALTVFAAGPGVYHVSEMEIYPRTVYGKSVRTMETQLQLHTMAGVSEITLNMLSPNLAPVCDLQRWFEALRVNRPQLEWLQGQLRGKRLTGIGFPWHQDLAKVQFDRGETAGGLVPDASLPLVLSRLGLPIQFGESLCGVNFLSGELPLCLGEEALLRLLSQGLLLDCAAAEHLCRMGYSELLGVALPRRLTEACYEQFSDDAFCGPYSGQFLAAYTRSPDQEPPAVFTPLMGARPLTQYLDRDGRPIGGACHCFENHLGGRVAVLSSWTRTGQYRVYPQPAYLLGELARWASRGGLPLLLRDAPNVAPLVFTGPDGDGLAAFVNTGLDDIVPRAVTSKTLLPARGALHDPVEALRISYYRF